jgi:hypothetical protein
VNRVETNVASIHLLPAPSSPKRTLRHPGTPFHAVVLSISIVNSSTCHKHFIMLSLQHDMGHQKERCGFQEAIRLSNALTSLQVFWRETEFTRRWLWLANNYLVYLLSYVLLIRVANSRTPLGAHWVQI